jgi:tRNA modification GTPase
MQKAPNIDHTIVALATPFGKGAIAVVRLSGKEAISIADKCFKGADLENVNSHTVHYGHLINKVEVIDEVMLSVFKAPRTYTAEDIVEVSCHGSTYIQERVVQLFLDNGARMADRGEFTLRAFLNGRIDLSQAEAVGDLINAESEKAKQVALNQMRGGFSRQIKKLKDQLVHFASMVELELDFSEEDVEFADRSALVNLVKDLLSSINGLLDSFKLGNVIRNGVPTVIIGRPNAGKSTLLNGLLQDERAIVSEIPGTTRDTIEEVLHLNGISFRFVDTAGIREAEDVIESAGIERTRSKIGEASVMLYVFDPHNMTKEEYESDLEKLRTYNKPFMSIANKADLGLPEWLNGHGDETSISAKTNQGIEQVKEKLMGIMNLNAIDNSNVIVTNSRHYQSLNESQAALEDVLKAIDNGLTGDLLAVDIRRALHALGEITGEITPDDLLGEIFSNFCIGK